MTEITRGAGDREPGTTHQVAGAQARLDLRSGLTFALLILLIAMDAVVERFLNQQLPPFLLAGTRFAAAGLLALGLARALRLPFPRGRTLAAAVAFGLLQFALGYALLYWALQRLPASLSSMVLSSVPLFTLLLAAAARQEPFRLRGLIGALVALTGIAVLVGGQAGGEIPVLRAVAVLGTALLFSLGAVLLKSVPQAEPLSMSAISMLVGAPMLLALSVLSGETGGGISALLPSAPLLWWAQAYLIIPGTLGVYALMFHLLSLWPASTLSYQSVLIPPVTTLLSVWLLNEAIAGGFYAGGALVLVGVYLGTLSGRQQRRP